MWHKHRLLKLWSILRNRAQFHMFMNYTSQCRIHSKWHLWFIIDIHWAWMTRLEIYVLANSDLDWVIATAEVLLCIVFHFRQSKVISRIIDKTSITQSLGLLTLCISLSGFLFVYHSELYFRFVCSHFTIDFSRQWLKNETSIIFGGVTFVISNEFFHDFFLGPARALTAWHFIWVWLFFAVGVAESCLAGSLLNFDGLWYIVLHFLDHLPVD